MLGRKKGKQVENPEDVDPPVEEEAAEQEPPAPARAAFDRGEGPFDVAEMPDGGQHADFGALWVPGVDGLSVRLEQDPGTGQFMAMTIVVGTGAVQVRALAAPRSGGQWDANRQALRDQIASTGGRADEVAGPFGEELHAQVPAPPGQAGGQALQPMRFVGVDGPRWLLTGAFVGSGTDPATWDPVNEVFRRLVVVRGEEAMPVGALLALRAPEQPQQEGAEQEGAEQGGAEQGGAEQGGAEQGDPRATTLDSLEPTDRITEVR